MTLRYLYRSVPYPGIIREASSGNRWEQTQRPTPRHVERESKWELSIKDGAQGVPKQRKPLRDGHTAGTLSLLNQLQQRAHD